MAKAPHRYVEISQLLEDDIHNGLYPLGSLLPTEAQLCKAYEISRFTARNSLAILEEKGLIKRTQGRGSVVVSLQTSMFKDTWSSIDELLAHAGTVHTVFNSIDEIVTDDDLSDRLGFCPGEPLIQLNGVRFQSENGKEIPICTIRIWIQAKHRDVTTELTDLKGSVAYLLEKQYGKRSIQVDQAISACTLDSDTAASLEATTGEAALHLERKFIDENYSVFEASESVLPASRFTYHMRLRRS